jgi:hypothetical protein
MKKGLKIGLIITGAALIGGTIAYFLNKNYTLSDEELDDDFEKDFDFFEDENYEDDLDDLDDEDDEDDRYIVINSTSESKDEPKSTEEDTKEVEENLEEVKIDKEKDIAEEIKTDTIKEPVDGE